MILGKVEANGRMAAEPAQFRFTTRRVDSLLSLQGARFAMRTDMNDGSEVVLE